MDILFRIFIVVLIISFAGLLVGVIAHIPQLTSYAALSIFVTLIIAVILSLIYALIETFN